MSVRSSSVPTHTLVVHNIALYRLGGAQDNFACSLSNFFDGVQWNVVSLSVYVFIPYRIKIVLYSETCIVFMINPIDHQWGLLGPRKHEIVSIFLIGFT